MPFKRILWPTDLSKQSYRALPYVNDISRQMGAEVVVLYVPEDITRYPDYVYGGPSMEHIQKMFAWEVEEGRKRLETTCSDHLGGCPGYQVKVVPGVPVAEILNAVDAFKVDLVVMAPHGRGSADPVLAFDIGSTTDRVLRRSPVPVLVVTGGGKPAR